MNREIDKKMAEEVMGWKIRGVAVKFFEDDERNRDNVG